MLLLGRVIQDPSLGIVVCAVPFWVAGLFTACLLVWMLFGKETLVLGRNGAFFRRRAWIPLMSRAVPREELLAFREYHLSYKQNHDDRRGIEMASSARRLPTTPSWWRRQAIPCTWWRARPRTSS